MEEEFSTARTIHPPGIVTSHPSPKWFQKLLQVLPQHHQNTKKKCEKDETKRGKYYRKKVDQYHLKNESFPFESVFNTSAQLFPDTTFSFSTKFTGAEDSGEARAGSIFGNILPIMVPSV